MAKGKETKAFSVYREEWTRVRLPAYHHEVESLFEELIHRTWGRAEWQPLVDVIETDAAFIVELDLPGVDPASVQVAVEDSRMLVTGTRTRRKETVPGQVRVAERSMGRFARLLEFRAPIDATHLEKEFADGVLRLILPKLKPGESR